MQQLQLVRDDNEIKLATYDSRTYIIHIYVYTCTYTTLAWRHYLGIISEHASEEAGLEILCTEIAPVSLMYQSAIHTHNLTTPTTK